MNDEMVDWIMERDELTEFDKTSGFIVRPDENETLTIYSTYDGQTEITLTLNDLRVLRAFLNEMFAHVRPN